MTGEVFMQSGRSAMGYAITETGSAVGVMALTKVYNHMLKMEVDFDQGPSRTTDIGIIGINKGINIAWARSNE